MSTKVTYPHQGNKYYVRIGMLALGICRNRTDYQYLRKYYRCQLVLLDISTIERYQLIKKVLNRLIVLLQISTLNYIHSNITAV